MNTKSAPWALRLLVLAAVVAIIIGSNLMRNRGIAPASLSETRAMADAALAAKFTGPRYFHAPAGAAAKEGGPWLTVHEAMAQVPRVAAERNLGPEATAALGDLVGKLSEPHPYRMVGGERVTLLRLNLSLDSIQ